MPCKIKDEGRGLIAVHMTAISRLMCMVAGCTTNSVPIGSVHIEITNLSCTQGEGSTTVATKINGNSSITNWRITDSPNLPVCNWRVRTEYVVVEWDAQHRQNRQVHHYHQSIIIRSSLLVASGYLCARAECCPRACSVHIHTYSGFLAFLFFTRSNLLSCYTYIHLSTNTCIMSDLKAWLEEVSADSGTDVTGHLDSLTTHGTVYITRFYFSFSPSFSLPLLLPLLNVFNAARSQRQRTQCVCWRSALALLCRQTNPPLKANMLISYCALFYRFHE